MFFETSRLALRAISRNLLRSFLTVLGVVIGVAAVIAMVTIGNGTTEQVKSELSRLGTNMLFVRPASSGPAAPARKPNVSMIAMSRRSATRSAACAPLLRKTAAPPQRSFSAARTTRQVSSAPPMIIFWHRTGRLRWAVTSSRPKIAEGR